MGREILVFCDPCKKEGKERVPAEVLSFASVKSVPGKPAEEAEVVVTTLEVCKDHQAPYVQMATMKEDHGQALDDEAQRFLTLAVKSGGRRPKASTTHVRCQLCPDKDRLALGSRNSHAESHHGKKGIVKEDWGPYYPEEEQALLALLT